MEITKSLIASLEEPFINEQGTSSKPFEINQGHIPILLSAPHSVPQLREGRIKKGEYRTGVIAKLLHQLTGCYSIYKTKNVNDDANFDPENPYKDEILDLISLHKIRYVFDIHIMAPDREHMIDIGTGRGKNVKNNPSIIQTAKQAFVDHDISNVEIDKLFPASFPYTVSSHISRESGIDCLQIEINWKLIDISESLDQFDRVLDSLKQIIDHAKQHGN